jgi:hypothetical protein
MCLCCGEAKWQREFVVDHKFDYVKIDEFESESRWLHFKYLYIYVFIIRGVVVYVADLLSLVVQFSGTSGVAGAGSPNNTGNEFLNYVYEYLKWIYLVCVLISFALLAVDVRKARRIIKSRDISFAFTSVIAYRYYAIKKFAYFCFFEMISDNKTFQDKAAMFVYFQLKSK